MTKTILLVDDDTLVRKGLAAGLSASDYKVVEAGDGKEGLKLALEQEPNIVVTDVRMPGMDGLEMIDELRKDKWGKSVPVIIMSNDDTTPTLNKALEAGVTIYLAKQNLTPDVLVQEVTEALKN